MASFETPPVAADDPRRQPIAALGRLMPLPPDDDEEAFAEAALIERLNSTD